MELIWLESFVTLAETCNLRAAASQLGISPTTLSERIAQLESYLGARLLNRSRKGSALTEQGQVFLQDARKLLQSWSDISTHVQIMDSTPSSSLRIVFQDRSPVPVVCRFLDDFLMRHPDITPCLYSDQDIALEDGLLSGRVDLYFAYAPQITNPVLARRPVFSTRLGVLLPTSHRLAWKPSLSLKELDGETLILYPETLDPSLRSLELAAIRASGIRYNLFKGELSPMYYSFPVSMGQGVAMIPWLMRTHKPPRVASIPLSDPLCQCTIDMVYSLENSNPALLTFLREYGDRTGVDDL